MKKAYNSPFWRCHCETDLNGALCFAEIVVDQRQVLRGDTIELDDPKNNVLTQALVPLSKLLMQEAVMGENTELFIS